MITNYLDYVALCAKLAEYQQTYHNTGTEPIPNDEYDSLRKELIAWEKAHPDQTLELSPAFNVGHLGPERRNEDARHEYPMLSLENALNEEEKNSWVNLWVAKYGADVAIIGEFKYDGIALSLRYVDGQFVRALTRGDGEYGEDVTRHAAEFVPLHIEAMGVVEVRGEAVVKKDRLDLINMGRDKYANARSAVVGLMNPDRREVSHHASGITFIPYDLEGPDFVFEKYTNKLEALKQLGFRMMSCFVATADQIQTIFEQVQEIRLNGDLQFDIDGMVWKLDDIAKQLELGNTNYSPRHSFAYKFPPISAPCTVLNVVFQVGRSGEIAPVAKITATALMGVIVTSVLLHNEERMTARKLAVGNMYEVYRSGDVIPHLGKLIKESELATPVKFPECCPACNAKVEKRGATYYCPNSTGCPSQSLARLAYAVSRDVIPVEGLAEQTIQLLLNADLVRCVADIFKLRAEDLAQLHGYTQYSAEKLAWAIRLAKTTTFDRYIAALGIPEVGKSTARNIASRIFKHKTLLEFETVDQLLDSKIPGVGKETAANIIDYFADPQRRMDALDLLKQLHIPDTGEVVPVFGVAGKTFVFTGKFGEPRDIMENKVLAAGGFVSSSVSAKTDYLVRGERPGSNLRKAAMLKVDVIDERTFLSLFENTDQAGT